MSLGLEPVRKTPRLTAVGVQLRYRGAGNDRETGVSHPEVPAVEGHVAGLLDGYGEEDAAVGVQLHYGVVSDVGHPEMLPVEEEVYRFDAYFVDALDSTVGMYLGHLAADGVRYPEVSSVEYGASENSTYVKAAQGLAVRGELEHVAGGGGHPQVGAVEGEGLGQGAGGELGYKLAVQVELGNGVGAHVGHPDVPAVEEQVPGNAAHGEGLNSGR